MYVHVVLQCKHSSQTTLVHIVVSRNYIVEKRFYIVVTTVVQGLRYHISLAYTVQAQYTKLFYIVSTKVWL